MTTGITINETPIALTIGEVQGPRGIAGTNGTNGATGPSGASGNAANIASSAAIATATISAGVQVLTVFSGNGILGQGVFYARRVNSQPSHVWKFRSLDRYIADAQTIDNTNGGWWEGFVQDDIYTIEQFGGIGDAVSVSATGTDNLTAFNNFQSYITSKFVGGNAFPMAKLLFGRGVYYFSDTINLTVPLILEGVSSGDNSGGVGSWLTFPVNTCGICVNRYNTYGPLTAPVTPRTFGADGSRIKNLGFSAHTSGMYPLHPTAYGVWARARCLIEDCTFWQFANGGISVVASTGGGGDPTAGNADEFEIRGCTFIYMPGAAVYIQGGNANAGITHKLSIGFCGIGLWDASFLGNAHYSPNTEACGWGAQISNFANGYCSLIQYNGNVYSIITGDVTTVTSQVTLAQTTRPSGTTAANAVWYYVDTAANYNNLPPIWGEVTRNGNVYVVVPGQEANMWTSDPASSPAVWGTGTPIPNPKPRYYIDWSYASLMATGSAPYVDVTGPYYIGGPWRIDGTQTSTLVVYPYTEGSQIPLGHSVGNGFICGGNWTSDPYSTVPILNAVGGALSVDYGGGLKVLPDTIYGMTLAKTGYSFTNSAFGSPAPGTIFGMGTDLSGKDVCLGLINPTSPALRITMPGTTQQFNKGQNIPYATATAPRWPLYLDNAICFHAGILTSGSLLNADYYSGAFDVSNNILWGVGDTFIESTPSKTNSIIKRCITAGAPGTWETVNGVCGPYTIAAGAMQLPTAGTVGRTAWVTDGAAALAWGATISGGGTDKYLVWDNGVNWTVVGK